MGDQLGEPDLRLGLMTMVKKPSPDSPPYGGRIGCQGRHMKLSYAVVYVIKYLTHQSYDSLTWNYR